MTTLAHRVHCSTLALRLHDALKHGAAEDARPANVPFDEERLVDLLADLRHAALVRGIDFARCDLLAGEHFTEEMNDLDEDE